MQPEEFVSVPKRDYDLEARRSPIKKTGDTAALYVALLRAQKNFKPVYKTLENTYLSTEEKRVHYADLNILIDATKDALAAENLLILQMPTYLNGKNVAITTILALASPHAELESQMEIPGESGKGKFDAQTVVAADTYARRVAYKAILNLPEFEDDGNRNAGSDPEPEPEKTETKRGGRPRKQTTTLADVTTNVLPTKDERAGYAKRIREYSPDEKALSVYLKRVSAPAENSSQITHEQWKGIFQQLDEAKTAGKISELLRGENGNT